MLGISSDLKSFIFIYPPDVFLPDLSGVSIFKLSSLDSSIKLVLPLVNSEVNLVIIPSHFDYNSVGGIIFVYSFVVETIILKYP